MGRYLIVANQTLGGEVLEATIRDLISEGGRVFYVLVPMTEVEHEAAGAWAGGFAFMDPSASVEAQRRSMEAAAQQYEAEEREARHRAQYRLDRMVEMIRSAGGQAEGEVGTQDPAVATKAVLERQADFDGIVVSTLPSGISRWLKMDAPSRIARMTDVPVTTVEARA